MATPNSRAYLSPKSEKATSLPSNRNNDISFNSSFSESPKKYENDIFDRPYLPDCWLDNKRMEVLFNPFRVREINPEGWDLKMNFWINLINKWCLQQRKVVITVDEVCKAFVRGDQFPHHDCIKLVFSQMKRNDKILFREDLAEKKNATKSFSRYLTNITINSLVVKPFTLGWGLISGNKDEEINVSNEDKILPTICPDTKLINRETLDILLESVESNLNNMKTTCMRYLNFLNLLNKNVFSEKHIDEATFEIILEVLESKNKIKTFEESGIKIVKFGNDIEIKQTDISLIKLEATKEILEAEATKLYEEMEIIRKEARVALESKSRDKALMLLKRKKRIENKLKDKDNQIDNIELVYEQLLETDSQQLIMKAFQLANDILKKNAAHLENVEQTVSQVEETLGDISSLTLEVNRPIGDTTAFELDAEEELNQILQDIEDEKAVIEAEANKKQANNSPNVSKVSDSPDDDSFMAKLTDLTIIDSDFSIDEITPTKLQQANPV